LRFPGFKIGLDRPWGFQEVEVPMFQDGPGQALRVPGG